MDYTSVSVAFCIPEPLLIFNITDYELYYMMITINEYEDCKSIWIILITRPDQSDPYIGFDDFDEYLTFQGDPRGLMV